MKKNVVVLLCLLPAMPLLAAEPAETCVSAWRHVFSTDQQGKDFAGDRQALLNALRRGSPLRVGWGEADAEGNWSVEEFADAEFTNLMGNRDVVAQLVPALIQTDYIDAGKAGFRDPPLMWYGMASTDGRFEAIMLEPGSGKVYRKLAQRTHFHWYVFAPPASCDDRPLINSAPKGRRNAVVGDDRDRDSGERKGGR